MTDYTKSVDFAAKDLLSSGDPSKIIKGTEFGTEFDNIATAIATKSNIASPTFTGTTTIPTVDINGGAIDAVTLGTNSAVTEAQVDNININGNTISSSNTNGNVNISPNGTGTVVINTDLDVDNINVNGNAIISTDTNGNIDLTPNGTGEVNISKVDIDSGAIDGTVIGAASAAAITGTTITGTSFVTSGNMTFGDDDKAIFGAGSDLQIYHDSATSTNKIIGSFDVTGDITLGDTDPTITFNDSSVTNLSHSISSASDNLRITADVNGVDAGSRVEIFDGTTEVARFEAGAVDITGTVTADGLTVDTTTLVVDSANNRVGIGTSSPNTILHVSSASTTKSVVETTGAASDALIEFTKGQGSGNTWSMGIDHSNSSAFSLAYLSNGSPSLTAHGVLTVNTSGNLFVGCTAPPDASNFGGSINPIGQFRSSRNTTSSATQFSFNNTNGEVGTIVTSGTSTAYNTSSDQRLKENIVDAPSASDDIDAIQVRSFDWKADGSHQKYGMVAQELQTVAPEAVSQPEDPEEMMGVDYSKLVPMMLKEIQSLRARVAQLEGTN